MSARKPKFRRRCTAFVFSESGKERCNGYAGHKFHFYRIWRSLKKWQIVRWKNRNWRECDAGKKGTVQVGDLVRVPKEQFFRGGHEGHVIQVTSEGCVIDFEKDCFGDHKGLPSIEMWQENELEFIGRLK